jgi:glucose-1-phosphatase
MDHLLNGIKNIIFDFGGVILNLDFNQSFEAFKALGIENFDEMYSMAVQSELFNQLETGSIEPDIFVENLKSQLPEGTTKLQIVDAWNAMLLDIPEQRIEMLLQLKSKYRTFLLSNTNAIHYDKYVDELHKLHGHDSFASLFEKDYFSHTLGIKKPGREIYDYVIEKHGLAPDETLFIDDTEKNLKGAKESGLRTYLLPPNQEIVELFNKIF